MFIGTPDAGTPENILLFHGGKNEFDLTTVVTPYLENVYISASNRWEKVFDYAFDAATRAGNYFIHVALVDKESGEIVSEDHANVNYDPDEKSPFVELETPPIQEGVKRIPIPTTLDIIRDWPKSQKIETIGLIANIVDEQGIPVFKTAKIAFDAVDKINTLGEVDSVIALYYELDNDVLNGSITSSQRDSLMVVDLLTRLLTFTKNGQILYKEFDAKSFVGSIKNIAGNANRHYKELAIVNLADGGDFESKFKFDHRWELFRRKTRLIQVKLDAIIVFNDSLYNPQPIAKDKMKDMYSCTFEAMSRSEGSHYDNFAYVELPFRGIYLVTVADEYKDAIHRRQVLVDGKTHNDVVIDYTAKVHHKLSEWDDYDSVNGFTYFDDESRLRLPIAPCDQTEYEF